MTIWTYVTGWTLVHFVWQGTLIGLLTAVLLRALHGSASTVRYATGCVALGAILGAPVVTAITLSQNLDEIAPLTLLSKPSATDAVLAAAATTTVVRTSVEGLAGSVTVDTLLPALVLVWFVGVALLGLRMASGAWRVHRIHRRALRMARSRWSAEAERVAARLGLDRALRVVDAAMVTTPTVIGYLRPVVLLPIAAFGTLTPEQVEAILAHELAHIRRHDGIVNLMQVLAETVLFYHPAVWWVSSRIRTEREHCCDDVAVSACGDPVRYAEALTELAAWNTPSPRLALSATSGSLVRRVRRILLPRPHVARSRQGLAVAAIMLAFLGALTLVVRAQIPAAEIVTTLRDGSLSRTFGPRDVNRLIGYELFPGPVRFPTDDPQDARAWDATIQHVGGQMPFKGFTARGLIRYAYGLTEIPVVAGPEWLDSESISFTATTPAATPDDGDFRLAIRTALDQQFHLRTHHEVRDFPAYALTLVNGQPGPNLKASDGACVTSEMLQDAARSGRRLLNGQRTLVCRNEDGFSGRAGFGVTSTALARSIGRPWVDREVVDETGLQGRFDYRLDLGVVPLSIAVTARPALAPLFRPFGVEPLPKALAEQLGLQLEPTTVSHDVLVIDSAERLAPARDAAPVAKTQPAVLEPRLKRAPWAGAVERVARFAAAPAQAAPGSVSGTFNDQLNNFLPAVHLTLVNEATGQRYDATTGRSGDFAVSDLPAGSYQLTASLPGFRGTTQNVTIRPGMNTQRDVVMAIGMIEETIIVVSDGTPPAALPTYQRRTVAPPPPSTARGMGGNLRAPRKLRHVAPIYPASGAEGVVILTAVISLDGTVTNTRPLSSPDPDLAQAAMDAVNLWEFDPTLLDGIPVDTLMQVTVSFSKPR